VFVVAPADDGPVAAERAAVNATRRQAGGVHEIDHDGGCEPKARGGVVADLMSTPT
jgi:hypothetical protein